MKETSFTYKKVGLGYRQSPHEDDAWESQKVWRENRLNGSSHHNMEKKCKVKQHKAMHRMNRRHLPSTMILRMMRGRLLRDHRSFCRRRMDIQKCRRTMDELTLMSIRCGLGCCRHLGCRVLNRKDQSCNHLHLILHSLILHSLIRHSPSQSSRFHAFQFS